MLFAVLLTAMLYLSLSHPDYEVREASQSRLEANLAAHGPRLLAWVGECTCTERKFRVRAVIRRWRGKLAAEYTLPVGVPCFPICDAFPIACPLIPFSLADLRDRSHWPVESCPGPGPYGGPAWPAYRATTERRVRQMIRAGATYGDVDLLVRRMFLIEQAVRSDCGVLLPSVTRAGPH